MELVADILLIAATLGASVYCVILSRRLRRFTDLEKGVGGAIAVLSVQVDDMTKTLAAAQDSAEASTGSLASLTVKAETAAKRLELMVASLHDIPAQPEVVVPQAETPEDGLFHSRRAFQGQAAE